MRDGGSRLALAIPLLGFIAAMVALATAGSPGAAHTSTTAPSSTPGMHRRAGTAQPSFAAAPHVTATNMGTLPAAVEDAAVAPAGAGRVALLGGIDAAQSSTDQITIVDGGATSDGGTLIAPQHDAQAARLGAYVYVFGGGVVSSFDHILRYDPSSRQVTQVGALPTSASDVAVSTVGSTAYVVGGYDGVHPLDTIVAWRPDMGVRVVGHLPTGLRYAAVAGAGDRLIIAGGSAGPSETLSDVIFSFDTATGALARIGRLPVALTHASAVTLDGQVLVVGGRRSLDGSQTDAILAIDPVSGRVRTAGHLPSPLSDAAVTTSGERVVVAGGASPAGTERAIIALVAATH